MIGHMPWIEMSLLTGLVGIAWSRGVEATGRARRRALLCGSIMFAFTVASWLTFVTTGLPDTVGGGVFGVDWLNAPFLPLTALVFLVTMAVTLRTEIRRFSFGRTLLFEVLVLSVLWAQEPWAVILLLGVSTLPLISELRARGRSIRVVGVHMGTSLSLLIVGWILVSYQQKLSPSWAMVGYAMVAAGVAIRSGLVPAHCWVVDTFENAALGTSLLTMLPPIGVYLTLRLLAPGAPDVVLLVLAYLAGFGALYNAAMSVVQNDARRFLGQVVLTHSLLALTGIALLTPLAITAGLILWISVSLSVMGLGLTLRSLEARTGRLSLTDFRGLYVQTPTLAALFLVLGLAAVGFPGTLGFFGLEMVMDAATRGNRALAVFVVLSAALSGVAVVRAYGKLFLGTRHQSTLDLRIRRIELLALLVLVLLLVGGTFWPQLGISLQQHTVDVVTNLRAP